MPAKNKFHKSFLVAIQTVRFYLRSMAVPYIFYVDAGTVVCMLVMSKAIVILLFHVEQVNMLRIRNRKEFGSFNDRQK